MYKRRAKYLPVSEFPPALSEVEEGRGGERERGLDRDEVHARFRDAYKDPALNDLQG